MESLLRDSLIALGKLESLHTYLDYLHSEWFTKVEDLRVALNDETAWANIKLPARLKIELKRQINNIPAEEDTPTDFNYTQNSWPIWSKVFSSEHNCYYFYNNVTTESQWEAPENEHEEYFPVQDPVVTEDSLSSTGLSTNASAAPVVDDSPSAPSFRFMCDSPATNVSREKSTTPVISSSSGASKSPIISDLSTAAIILNNKSRHPLRMSTPEAPFLKPRSVSPGMPPPMYLQTPTPPGKYKAESSGASMNSASDSASVGEVKHPYPATPDLQFSLSPQPNSCPHSGHSSPSCPPVNHLATSPTQSRDLSATGASLPLSLPPPTLPVATMVNTAALPPPPPPQQQQSSVRPPQPVLEVQSTTPSSPRGSSASSAAATTASSGSTGDGRMRSPSAASTSSWSFSSAFKPKVSFHKKALNIFKHGFSGSKTKRREPNESGGLQGEESDGDEDDEDDGSEEGEEAAVEADKDLVLRLREMGFTKQAAILALQETKNNMSTAAFLLVQLQQEGEEVTESASTPSYFGGSRSSSAHKSRTASASKRTTSSDQ